MSMCAVATLHVAVVASSSWPPLSATVCATLRLVVLRYRWSFSAALRLTSFRSLDCHCARQLDSASRDNAHTAASIMASVCLARHCMVVFLHSASMASASGDATFTRPVFTRPAMFTIARDIFLRRNPRRHRRGLALETRGRQADRRGRDPTSNNGRGTSLRASQPVEKLVFNSREPLPRCCSGFSVSNWGLWSAGGGL